MARQVLERCCEAVGESPSRYEITTTPQGLPAPFAARFIVRERSTGRASRRSWVSTIEDALGRCVTLLWMQVASPRPMSEHLKRACEVFGADYTMFVMRVEVLHGTYPFVCVKERSVVDRLGDLAR